MEPEITESAADFESQAVRALEQLQAAPADTAMQATEADALPLGADARTQVEMTQPAPQLLRAAPAGGAALSNSAPADLYIAPPPSDTEIFANETPNPLKITAEEPVSTFSIDVDTAAYSLVRSSLTAGHLPAPDAVRIEELINYFPYDYAAPDGPHPFQPTVNVFETPWNEDTQLVHIGIQGEMPALEDRPPLNLVFLIDTSGSMNQPNKLPLLRQSFRLMLDNLRPEDEVGDCYLRRLVHHRAGAYRSRRPQHDPRRAQRAHCRRRYQRTRRFGAGLRAGGADDG